MQTTLDPDEARRFAKWLEDETESLEIDLQRVSVALVELSAEWNDGRYHESLCNFEVHSRKLKGFLEGSTQYVNYLRRAADIVEHEYYE